MQVVWEANTADFARRKRAARACEKCQRRKKKCHHTFSNDSAGDNLYRDDHSSDLNAVLPTLTHKEPVRFVGDLNPESILTDLSSREKGASREVKFGTWIQSSEEPPQPGQDEVDGNGGAQQRIHCSVERSAKVERAKRSLALHEKQYLQAVGAFRILPRTTQDILVSAYIGCIDSLMPIIDGGRLLKEYAEGSASIFLIQAICMVASKTGEAAPYLCLTEDGPLMDPIPFARALHSGLDAAMKADLESDRLTKVQILALMSLHNDGPGGLEESSMHLAQAIHNAHSAGLHVLTSGRRLNDEASYTWWSLWCLDKFNACLGGRAIMIADRDMGITRPETEADEFGRSHGLALWLALASLLSDVISFYRPTSNPDSTGWEMDFPSFQSLAAGLHIPNSSHQTCLEIGYNVIAILTCRSGGPSTASYRRRVESANRIQQLMSSSSKNNYIEDVPPLPLIPYAVSLSLTVAYRLLRDKSPRADLEQAKQDLAVRCEMLESLRTRWWSADAMAKLGRKALASLRSPSQEATKPGDDVVGTLMEDEVAVCRFGPFSANKARNDEGVNDAMQRTGNCNVNDMIVDGQSGNALDVLSSAAASLGESTAVTTTTPSTMVSAYPPPDELGQMALPMPTFATDLANGVDSVDEFRDLDMLFGDFFDLGMPTMFEDPLFEGAAFADFG